jgi:hypothetical protein
MAPHGSYYFTPDRAIVKDFPRRAVKPKMVKKGPLIYAGFAGYGDRNLR